MANSLCRGSFFSCKAKTLNMSINKNYWYVQVDQLNMPKFPRVQTFCGVSGGTNCKLRWSNVYGIGVDERRDESRTQADVAVLCWTFLSCRDEWVCASTLLRFRVLRPDGANLIKKCLRFRQKRVIDEGYEDKSTNNGHAEDILLHGWCMLEKL